MPGAVQRVPPHVRIVVALLSVVAVVATPREAWWAFVLQAAVVVLVARVALVPAAVLARRLLIGLPFLAFAVLLPFIARGEQVEIGPFTVSEEGLWGAWNVIAKGGLGLAIASLLTASTPVADLLRGLDRLRVPRVFTAIAGFMVRYLDVVGGDLHRMRVARISRGSDPRWPWQAKAVATTAGSLFVRTYERGERIHLAMLSRGFDGTFPQRGDDRRYAGGWSALTVPAVMGAIALLARWVA